MHTKGKRDIEMECAILYVSFEQALYLIVSIFDGIVMTKQLFGCE
jgi:hypothetical protein